MPSQTPGFDQSDRAAHAWTIAEPGSWSELAESTAFVFRAFGLALHPMTLALAGLAALATSWAVPIHPDSLLPWMGGTGVGATFWAWGRMVWIALVVCVLGVVAARTIAARPTRAGVWAVLPTMLVSAGLCVCTYVATLGGAMLAAWLGVVVGGWIGGALGGSLAVLIGFLALLTSILATVLLLLAIPAIATNDADAPDAIQRAAAHLIARPGLSLALILLSVGLAWLLVVVSMFLLVVAGGGAGAALEGGATLVWLPATIGLFVGLALAWSALTQTVLTLREVVDREDRASCWDPTPQAEAIRRAIEARAASRQRPPDAGSASRD